MRNTLAMAALLLAAAATAHAQMKPGLWEIRAKSPEQDAARKQMQAQMDKMSPAQREQMQKAMGARGIAFGNDGAMRICHTEETVKRQSAPVNSETGCEVKHSASGSTRTVDMKCANGRTGHGEFTYASDGYKGWFETTDPARPGKHRTEYDAKFLGTDCGSVRPLVLPAEVAGKKG